MGPSACKLFTGIDDPRVVGRTTYGLAEILFAALCATLLASQAEARMACFGFVEGWCDPVRLHSGLGCRSPIAYETAMEMTIAEP